MEFRHEENPSLVDYVFATGVIILLCIGLYDLIETLKEVL